MHVIFVRLPTNTRQSINVGFARQVKFQHTNHAFVETDLCLHRRTSVLI